MALEWYTLDSALKRSQVIEGFTDFIWTERYNAYGEFEVKLPWSYANKSLLLPETRITKKDSTYVMTVETVTDEFDNQGNRILDITGRSLEAQLEDRVAMPALGNLATTPTWNLTGTPGDIMRAMFHDICVTGVLNVDDVIDFYHSGTILPSGGIPEPATPISVQLNPDSLYGSMKLVGDTYLLGFRLVRNGESSQVYFEVYTGTDRTTAQSLVPAVVFSPGLDNMTNQRFLTSTAPVKTVALVFAQNGSAEIYAVGADSSATGRGRRVLLVDASDINLAPGLDLDTAMAQRGLQALAAQQKVFTFDGQISEFGGYVYGKDYFLGDVVEQRDSNAYGTQMMVTEQIFISDAQGERSYPTLTLAQVIVPGTWLSWSPSDQVWASVDPAEEWGTL